MAEFTCKVSGLASTQGRFAFPQLTFPLLLFLADHDVRSPFAGLYINSPGAAVCVKLCDGISFLLRPIWRLMAKELKKKRDEAEDELGKCHGCDEEVEER